MEDFFMLDRGLRARRLSRMRTPALARGWLFVMNVSLESLEAFFRKFVRNG
jgi:hypothetical protein